MNEAPAPFLPADVDLRGYEYMPLWGGRLYGSDFNARASDAGFRAAMSLWWQAWNQVPAASLPCDEVVLTKLADMGRDLKAFRKVRSEALDGFVECSDGRLYHAQLAGWALDAWDRRVKERQRKANWRAHKERGRDGDTTRDNSGTNGGTETGQAAGHGRDVPAEGKVSEGKRSEAKVSDAENRASVVVQPSTPPAKVGEVKVAVLNGASQPRKTGQDWSDAGYVAATAKALGVGRHVGEQDSDFKDRVYEAVQAKLREAKAAIGRARA